MFDSLSNISQKAGMPPGSLVHVGDVLEAESRISLIDYSKDNIEVQTVQSINEILRYKEKETVTWVNIEGLKDVDLIDSVGQIFNIHPLVLEDILNTHQRPKFEEYDDYLYIVLKGLTLENDKFPVNYEQISIIVLNNFVFTFKEKQDDLFSPIIKRLDNSKSRFRSMGSDYLAYAILDMIIDLNFNFLDPLDEIIDSVED
jgi:magnesium transporter